MADQVDDVESCDRISSLPDGVLRHLLSLLPTKIGVSTCVLSTRWRYLFPFSNSLDFDDSLDVNPQGNENDQAGHFMDYVDRCIMLMNETRVDKFRLKCHRIVDISRVNSCICAAPLRNVRELDLCIHTGDLGVEPPCVFTCSTLVVLKLGIGFSLSVPVSAYLPYLKSLHLDSIEFSDDISIQSLFSSCPVLEDLVIVRCSMKNISILNFSSPSLKRLTVEKTITKFYHYSIVLDASSLVYLKCTITGEERFTLKNLHSLRVAHISIVIREYFNIDQIALPEFFEGICNVRSLYISGDYGKHLQKVMDQLPFFKNMNRLVLAYHPFLDLSVLMKLLQRSPNLETIFFDGHVWGSYGDGCVDVPLCVSSRLRSVECRLFYHGGPVIQEDVWSIEYFLKNANVLEKMSIRIGGTGRFNQQIVMELEKMMERIKMRPKAHKIEVFCELPLRALTSAYFELRGLSCS